jgi:hypothetical protein
LQLGFEVSGEVRAFQARHPILALGVRKVYFSRWSKRSIDVKENKRVLNRTLRERGEIVSHDQRNEVGLIVDETLNYVISMSWQLWRVREIPW